MHKFKYSRHKIILISLYFVIVLPLNQKLFLVTVAQWECCVSPSLKYIWNKLDCDKFKFQDEEIPVFLSILFWRQCGAVGVPREPPLQYVLNYCMYLLLLWTVARTEFQMQIFWQKGSLSNSTNLLCQPTSFFQVFQVHSS